MATLSTEEKLIRKVAMSKDEAINSVYKRFLMHFEAECSIGNKNYNDCFFIEYLYTQDHSNRTFANIAEEVLHVSESTLEKRRKRYIQIFDFFYNKDKAEKEAALTDEDDD